MSTNNNGLPSLPLELIEEIVNHVTNDGHDPHKLLPLRRVCRGLSHATWELFCRFYSLRRLRIVLSDKQDVRSLVRLSRQKSLAEQVKCIRFVLFKIVPSEIPWSWPLEPALTNAELPTTYQSPKIAGNELIIRKLNHRRLFDAQEQYRVGRLLLEMTEVFSALASNAAYPEVRMSSSELPSEDPIPDDNCERWRDTALRKELAYNEHGWWSCTSNHEYFETVLLAMRHARFPVRKLAMGAAQDALCTASLASASAEVRGGFPTPCLTHLELIMEPISLNSHHNYSTHRRHGLDGILYHAPNLRTFRLSLSKGVDCDKCYRYHFSDHLMDLFDSVADESNRMLLPKLVELCLDGVKVDPVAVQWLVYARRSTIRDIRITNIPIDHKGLLGLEWRLERLLMDGGCRRTEMRVVVEAEWACPSP